MATITSLKELIQKISTDDDRFFSLLGEEIKRNLSCLESSTTLSSLEFHYGKIEGILMALDYSLYISNSEIVPLRIELNHLRDKRGEFIITHVNELTKEGD